MTARPVVATIVAATHIGLIAALLFLTHRSRLLAPGASLVTTLFFVPDGTAPPLPPTPSPARPAAARRESAPVLAPRPPALPAAPPTSTAITIDRWYDSAADAAAAQARADEARERQAASMGRAAIEARSLAAAPRKPGPDYAWSKAHTRRIEQVDGATILRLTERCVLVNFLLPVCALGKEEPRGDLFKDMNREPEFGDWKD